jgi:hypothetical protein
METPDKYSSIVVKITCLAKEETMITLQIFFDRVNELYKIDMNDNIDETNRVFKVKEIDHVEDLLNLLLRDSLTNLYEDREKCDTIETGIFYYDNTTQHLDDHNHICSYGDHYWEDYKQFLDYFSVNVETYLELAKHVF